MYALKPNRLILVLFISIAFLSESYGQSGGLVNVKIVDPVDNATIDGYRLVVRGTSSGMNRDTLNLYILVHPVQTSQWWVQSPPTVDQNGSWIADVYLGTPDMGNKQGYAIQAIVSSHELREGETLLINGVPPSQANHQIFVTRKDKSFLSFVFSGTGLTIIGIVISVILFVLGLKYRKQKREKDKA